MHAQTCTNVFACAFFICVCLCMCMREGHLEFPNTFSNKSPFMHRLLPAYLFPLIYMHASLFTLIQQWCSKHFVTGEW